jgi:hypothetical protein
MCFGPGINLTVQFTIRERVRSVIGAGCDLECRSVLGI